MSTGNENGANEGNGSSEVVEFTGKHLNSDNARKRGFAQMSKLDEFESPNFWQSRRSIEDDTVTIHGNAESRLNNNDIDDFDRLHAERMTESIRDMDGRDPDSGTYEADDVTGEYPNGHSKQLRIALSQLARLEQVRRSSGTTEEITTEISAYTTAISNIRSILEDMQNSDWNDSMIEVANNTTVAAMLTEALRYVQQGGDQYVLRRQSPRGGGEEHFIDTDRTNDLFRHLRGFLPNTDSVTNSEVHVQQRVSLNIDYNTQHVTLATDPSIAEVDVEIVEYDDAGTEQSRNNRRFNTNTAIDFSPLSSVPQIGIRTYVDDPAGGSAPMFSNEEQFSLQPEADRAGTDVKKLTIARQATVNALNPNPEDVNIAGSIDCSYITRTDGTRAVRVLGVPNGIQTHAQLAYSDDSGSTLHRGRSFILGADQELEVPSDWPEAAEVYLAIGLPSGTGGTFEDSQLTNNEVSGNFASTPERQISGSEVIFNNASANARLTTNGLEISGITINSDQRFDIGFSDNDSILSGGNLGNLEGVSDSTIAIADLPEAVRNRIDRGETIYMQTFVTDLASDTWARTSAWQQLPYTATAATNAVSSAQSVELEGEVTVTAHQHGGQNGILVTGLGAQSNYFYQIRPSAQSALPVRSDTSISAGESLFVALPDDCANATEVEVAVGVLPSGAREFEHGNFQTITGYPGPTVTPDAIGVQVTPFVQGGQVQLQIQESGSVTGEDVDVALVDANNHTRVLADLGTATGGSANLNVDTSVLTTNTAVRIRKAGATDVFENISLNDVLPAQRPDSLNLSINERVSTGTSGLEETHGNTLDGITDPSLLGRMATVGEDGVQVPGPHEGTHRFVSTSQRVLEYINYRDRLRLFIDENVRPFWHGKQNAKPITRLCDQIMLLIDGDSEQGIEPLIRDLNPEQDENGQPVNLVAVDLDRLETELRSDNTIVQRNGSIQHHVRLLEEAIFERVATRADRAKKWTKEQIAEYKWWISGILAVGAVGTGILMYTASGNGESAKPREGSDPAGQVDPTSGGMEAGNVPEFGEEFEDGESGDDGNMEAGNVPEFGEEF